MKIKFLSFFQLRTWGRRRLTSFGFLLIRLQASLLASTLGNYNGNDDGEVDDIIK